MEEKKGSKKKKGTGKKIVVGFLGVGLIVGLTIAGTLAYLSTVSNEKQNTFVGSAGISLALSETKFDNNTAKLYGPGDEIDKNPQLINISDAAKTGDANPEQKEWVAMVVTYSLGDPLDPAKYNDLKGIIQDIEFNDASGDDNTTTAYWEQLTNTTNSTKYAMYLYNTTIVRNSSNNGVTTQKNITETQVTNSTLGSYTEPLFSKIKIRPQTDDAVGVYTTSNLPKFSIDVIGVAIKAEYTNNDGIITSYDNLSENQKNELSGRLKKLLESKISEGYKTTD